MRLYLPHGLLRRPGADFSDLTASTVTAVPFWDPDELDVLVIPFCPDPSPAEQETIRRRLVTADAAEEARYAALLEMTPSTPFEQMWLEAELARYESNGA